MTDPVQIPAEDIRRFMDEESLREWIEAQRWYAAKSRAVAGLEVVEAATLREDPMVFLALVQTRFATGTHELYQLPLWLTPDGDNDGVAAAIASAGEWTAYDALAEPERLLELVRRIDAEEQVSGVGGSFSFHRAGTGAPVGDGAGVRVMGIEQSNSSLVIDDRIVLKLFRKLEPGINPELEVLRFLSAREFPHVAELYGWYDYDGTALAATLGVAQQFVAGAVDGWGLVLDNSVARPDWMLDRLADLGTVTARMHNTLASDASDPAFSPEEPSQEALSLLTATVDENIERIFLRLPDDERVADIVGRGQDVRERLAARSHVGIGGRVIRTHGDYHLGQTLHGPRGWTIIDFEGEPARPLPERRAKRSPLRDVAGLLRSLAYVTTAAALHRGQPVAEEFEERARERFLAGYMGQIDTSLLPGGEAAIANLLSVFELEKAIYELQYELDNRPDWVGIPVAGIRRLLDAE